MILQDDLIYSEINTKIYRGKSPITDPLLIPTPSRISVTIRDIKKLYIYIYIYIYVYYM